MAGGGEGQCGQCSLAVSKAPPPQGPHQLGKASHVWSGLEEMGEGQG